MGKTDSVPEADAEYIRKNYERQSVPEIAKTLKRASVTVYKFFDQMGLQPRGRVITHEHPFKKKNRDLEQFLNGIKKTK